MRGFQEVFSDKSLWKIKSVDKSKGFAYSIKYKKSDLFGHVSIGKDTGCERKEYIWQRAAERECRRLKAFLADNHIEVPP